MTEALKKAPEAKFRTGQIVVINSVNGVLQKEGYVEKTNADGSINTLMGIIGTRGKDPLKDNHLHKGSIVRITNSGEKYHTIFPVFNRHYSNYGVQIPTESVVALTPRSLFELVIPNAIASLGFGRKKIKNK